MTPVPKPHLSAWGPAQMSQPFKKMPRAEAYALRRQIRILGPSTYLLADHGRADHPASTCRGAATVVLSPSGSGALRAASDKSFRGTPRRLTILGGRLHRTGQDQSLHAVGWCCDFGAGPWRGWPAPWPQTARRRTTSRAPKLQAPLGLVPGQRGISPGVLGDRALQRSSLVHQCYEPMAHVGSSRRDDTPEWDLVVKATEENLFSSCPIAYMSKKDRKTVGEGRPADVTSVSVFGVEDRVHYAYWPLLP
ncbi:hypothetical protein KVR01_007355 [Diaporthe batatas]|uniref:uncharacterized protein n=1 Tax=Diaporthe batatas TaxID=748121 RepID=UPI001D039DAC|nr:uncharacterized protein KVR01_007355 [Diaporthe batatas]KAG8162877.1 hypothetical protein KVR01_007355 [Diaporthe batatas]